MAISELTAQRNTNGGAASTSVTFTYPSTPTQGNLLVAVFSWRGDTEVTGTPSEWSLATNSGNGAGIDGAIYYKIAGASEPTVHTWTLGVSNKFAGCASEWSGIVSASPLDKINSNTGTGTAGTCGLTGTLSQANELVVAMFSNINTYTWASHNNGSAEILEAASTGGSASTRNNTSLATKIVSSTASVNYGATLSTSGTWSSAVATFKEELNQTITQSSLFTESDSIYAGTVTPGAVTVTQSSSYTNSATFFAGAVTPAYTITQSSGYVNESAFLSGSVTAGEVTVAQSSVFANDGVFYSGSVTPGEVTVLQSNIYSNTNAFYAGDVSAAGAITVTQDGAFSNSAAFYPGVVTAGAASITQDGIYSNSAVYYGGDVTTGAVDVDQNSSYANTQTFYPGAIFASGENITQASAHENAATFYSGEVNSNYSLLFDNVYINESLIYSGNLTTGVTQVDQTTIYENSSSFFDANVARQIQAAIEVVVSLNETVINCIYDVLDINVSEAANNIRCSHIENSIIVDYSGDFNIVVSV